MSTLLQTENLGINFGGLAALRNLTLRLEQGEMLGIIGPNGAGKTTIFNLITGVYRPTTGSIWFKGQRIDRLPPQAICKAGISRTFQNIRLIPYLSVLENVMLGMALRIKESPLDAVLLTRKTRVERKRWIDETEKLLSFLGLMDALNEDATSLPYGRQRAVEIARAIATGAEVILLDEPGAGMSVSEKSDLAKLIRDLRDRMQKSIIIVEHDIKLVFGLADRLIVLDYGCQIAEGDADVIKNDPKVIEAYLGRPEVTDDAGN